jgi:predicted TIM-barrel fold metal-dependent hydrolase
MQIDSHVHFLIYNAQEHIWVTDELSALKGSFLPNDLEPLLSAAGFDGCVAVEEWRPEDFFLASRLPWSFSVRSES